MQKQSLDSLQSLSISQGVTLKALLKTHDVSSLYRILDVSADCTDAEIQSAIAVQKNSGQPLSAEQVYAVEILGNPEERRRYDAQLIIRLSPTRVISQHDAEREDSPHSANSRNLTTKFRPYRLLIIMLCLAVAGVGGWSFFRGPLMQTKVAATKGTSTVKCTAIATKQYSENQRQAARERIQSRGWGIQPKYMGYALSDLEEGKPDAFEMITDFLVAGVDLNAPDDGSYPVLQRIWYDKHQTDVMLKLFLEHGGNINNPYEPPLVSAAMKGDIEIAKYLIDHCANVNLRAAQGSPVGYVLVKGHTPISAALSGAGNEKDAQRKLALVRLFLDHGADVNQPGGFDMMPVHDASTMNIELLKLVVERGAKLENPWILFAAINFGREENAIYLIQKGANLNYKGESGQTLLSLARVKNMNRVAKLLQEKGVQN